MDVQLQDHLNMRILSPAADGDHSVRRLVPRRAHFHRIGSQPRHLKGPFVPFVSRTPRIYGPILRFAIKLHIWRCPSVAPAESRTTMVTSTGVLIGFDPPPELVFCAARSARGRTAENPHIATRKAILVLMRITMTPTRGPPASSNCLAARAVRQLEILWRQPPARYTDWPARCPS